MQKIFNINKSTMICSFATLLIAMATTSPATAADFSKTCINIALQGSALTAQCLTWSPREREEQYVTTSLNLDNGIGNKDGILKWGGTNFSRTCKNIKLFGTRRSFFQADCLRPNRVTTVPSALNLDDRISNGNGVLKFD